MGSIARTLAIACNAGPWLEDQLVARMRCALDLPKGVRLKSLRTLARRIHSRFSGVPYAPCLQLLTSFILSAPESERIESRLWMLRLGQGESDGWWPSNLLALPPAQMLPAPPAIAGAEKLPQLPTEGALADWLGLSPAELDWFAGGLNAEKSLPDGRLNHYRYRWVQKASGALRLLEIPKHRLLQIQQGILHGILECIPPHAAAHAFRRGRSVATYLAPHAGRDVVLHLDLREFFPSLRRRRIHALFRTLGYPETVARLLTNLCTHIVPEAALPAGLELEERERLRGVYGSRHVPQGAPTSPALANLAAYRLDCRLAGLAEKAGAAYTRYADDLVFSGDARFARSLPRFRVLACAILLAEGFAIQQRKTRVMRKGRRQQVSGIVLNERPNIPRADYDALKAILHNCTRHGPESQNREERPHFREHLLGRIGYVAMIHPERGARLRSLFEQIEWGCDERRSPRLPRSRG